MGRGTSATETRRPAGLLYGSRNRPAERMPVRNSVIAKELLNAILYGDSLLATKLTSELLQTNRPYEVFGTLGQVEDLNDSTKRSFKAMHVAMVSHYWSVEQKALTGPALAVCAFCARALSLRPGEIALLEDIRDALDQNYRALIPGIDEEAYLQRIKGIARRSAASYLGRHLQGNSDSVHRNTPITSHTYDEINDLPGKTWFGLAALLMAYMEQDKDYDFCVSYVGEHITAACQHQKS
jgi:hypothetical protein